jgi:hypothetical protein
MRAAQRTASATHWLRNLKFGAVVLLAAYQSELRTRPLRRRPLLPGHVEIAARFFEKTVIDNLSDCEWLGDFRIFPH